VRCQGPQSSPAVVLFRCVEETRHRSELALARTSRRDVERKAWSRWRRSCCVRQFVVVGGVGGETADLAVPEAVVAEGEDLAGDSHLGDLGPRRLAIRSNFSRSGPEPVVIFCAASTSAQRKAGAALAGDVPEPGFAVGAADCGCECSAPTLRPR
jgi:hypothetical protein